MSLKIDTLKKASTATNAKITASKYRNGIGMIMIIIIIHIIPRISALPSEGCLKIRNAYRAKLISEIENFAKKSFWVEVSFELFLMSLMLCVKIYAVKMTIASLANSAGWKLKGPSGIHR